MQILMAHPLPCGNAASLVLQPAAADVSWRVLRKDGSAAFAGPDDPAAFRVYAGALAHITDARLLVNGVAYRYCAFGLRADGTWSAASNIAQVTPALALDDACVDAQEVVRERLHATLNALIQSGQVAATVAEVPVLSVPFYTQDMRLPVVTVLFGSGAPVAHALGDLLAVGDDGQNLQGWLQDVSLDVSVWSLNADERTSLRRALLMALAASLYVLAERGLDMVLVQSVTDTEDFESMNVPIYQTQLRLSCQVPVAVSLGSGADGVFDDVIVNNHWGL